MSLSTKTTIKITVKKKKFPETIYQQFYIKIQQQRKKKIYFKNVKQNTTKKISSSSQF